MKKGFTLVELIATLIVLSIVAIIVVPNIQKSIREVQEGLYLTQLQSIKEAAENWFADWIYENPDEALEMQDGKEKYVFLKDLIGYIGDINIIKDQSGNNIEQIVLYRDDNGELFNENIFVLITCNKGADNNYKYTYEVYDTNEKYLIYLAKKYAIENNVTSRISVTLSTLLNYANSNLLVCSNEIKVCTNIDSNTKLKNIEDGTLISNASVVIDYNNSEYSFTVNIS